MEAQLCDLLPDNNNSNNNVTEEDDWLASITAGSRLLARYHDRVWYEAIAEERLPAMSSTGDRDGDRRGFLAVRFKGFEADGPVPVAADPSHLAPLETPGDRGNASDTERIGSAQTDHAQNGGGGGSGGGGRGGATGSEEEEESDLEDAWADAPRVYEVGNGSARSDDGDAFFQERVLGDRRPDGGGGEGIGVARRGAGAEGGLCSDAYVFGDWEQHTKGFGSRMMSRMGYRRGEGLGREKQVNLQLSAWSVADCFYFVCYG